MVNKKIVLAGVLTAVVVAVIIGIILASTSSTTGGGSAANVAWSEWVLQGDAPSCGSGVSTYTRKCTIASVAQGVVDSCVKILGGSDTKTEEYNLGKCPLRGRYVIFERVRRNNLPGYGNSLNLAEIKVFDTEGVNLIGSGVTATSGSTLSGLGADRLIDSNLTTYAMTEATDMTKNWFQIDLGSNKNIGKIILENIRDSGQNRVDGAQLRIVAADGTTVFTSRELTQGDGVETITFAIQ